MATYATPTDLSDLGLPAGAIAAIPAGSVTAALDAASALADDYLAKQFTLPLTSYGKSLTRAVVFIASFDLLCRQGFNPENGSDNAVKLRYDQAIKWLEMVAAGDIEPVGVVDGTPSASDDTPLMESEPALGWMWPSTPIEDP